MSDRMMSVEEALAWLDPSTGPKPAVPSPLLVDRYARTIVAQAEQIDRLRADAGLPAPDRPGVWYPARNLDGGFGDVRSGRGKVVVMGLDYKGQPFRLILPADIADEYGRTLQAAATHAQKEETNE